MTPIELSLFQSVKNYLSSANNPYMYFQRNSFLLIFILHCSSVHNSDLIETPTHFCRNFIFLQFWNMRSQVRPTYRQPNHGGLLLFLFICCEFCEMLWTCGKINLTWPLQSIITYSSLDNNLITTRPTAETAVLRSLGVIVHNRPKV